MPRIPDFGSGFVKIFTKLMYPHHEFYSEFSRDIDAHVSEDSASATSTVERSHAGIQGFYSVASFMKKQPIIFSADPFKNQRLTRSVASINSSNEGNASDASTNEAAGSKSYSLSGLASELKGGSNLAKDIGIESRIFSELVSDPDFLNIFKHKAPIPSLDEARNQEDVFEPAEKADFLSSINATLLYDRAKYAASDLSYVNFATVIYRNRGFTVPAPPSDKDPEMPAGDESFPALPMAHREHGEEYVQSRERSVSDSSNTTLTRARVFSFSFKDDDADLDSATYSSDDEWPYVSVKLSSLGIFEKGHVICTTCRQCILMPDLPVLPAAASVRPAAGHRILQPDVVKVDLTNKVSEEDKLDDLLAHIRQLILESPFIDTFDSSSETAASIGEAVAHNRLRGNELMGFNDDDEEERPLRIPSRNLYTSNIILARDETESRAEECRRSSLYERGMGGD